MYTPFIDCPVTFRLFLQTESCVSTFGFSTVIEKYRYLRLICGLTKTLFDYEGTHLPAFETNCKYGFTPFDLS